MVEEESEDIQMARRKLTTRFRELNDEILAIAERIEVIKRDSARYRKMAEEIGIPDVENLFLKIENMRLVGW